MAQLAEAGGAEDDGLTDLLEEPQARIVVEHELVLGAERVGLAAEQVLQRLAVGPGEIVGGKVAAVTPRQQLRAVRQLHLGKEASRGQVEAGPVAALVRVARPPCLDGLLMGAVGGILRATV